MAGTTIRIFLLDGTPLGPRTVGKSNWTGTALEFPRVSWPDVRNRDELTRPGVYVLSGIDDSGKSRIYIGEADELKTRINQHFSGPSARGFWTRGLAFTSNDSNFNKAHVRYIESRLVTLGMAAKKATLENSNVPGQPSLSEADKDEAETFLGEMLVIYPLLGIDAFAMPTVSSAKSAELTIKGRGMKTTGAETPEGFVVREGSTAAAKAVPKNPPYLDTLRQNLVAEGVLVAQGHLLRLTQDYTFNSPSTAGGVMLGRSTNGRVAWKDEQGRSLKDLQGEASAE